MLSDVLGTLMAQENEFGWILTGPVQDLHPTQRIVSYYNSVKLDKFLTKFWEIGEIPQEPIQSENGCTCEKIYITTLRLHNDRYQVTLLFRDPRIE